ncbi:putative phage-related protein [Bordetella avium 197N]|uniref:Phage-related protein n=1 Tax=Bordetella avium (strain 197N) TaxID=360910 RepID=Q2KZ06_BORA1|nr:putative phage-related protein [Bordetella avium 197N]
MQTRRPRPLLRCGAFAFLYRPHFGANLDSLLPWYGHPSISPITMCSANQPPAPGLPFSLHTHTRCERDWRPGK